MIDPDVRKFIVGKTITNISEIGGAVVLEFSDGTHVWLTSNGEVEWDEDLESLDMYNKPPIVHLGFYGDVK